MASRDPVEPLPQWWEAEGLARVWARLAERLERNGLEARGRVQVDGLDRAERHAASGLLGRVVTTPRCTVDLAALDTRLRARGGAGLVEAAQQVAGRALADRPALRRERGQAREAPYAVAHQWLQSRPTLSWPWVGPWLEGLRRDGLPARDPDPAGLVLMALEVLAHCLPDAAPAPGAIPGRRARSRTELAAAAAHDAHALDDERRLSQVVLRALAARAGRPAPATARQRRQLWESVGIGADLVSSTCLTLGLRFGDGSRGGNGGSDDSDGTLARLSLAVAAGDPVHLTPWDLRRGARVAPGQEVLVCENPRVLEAVAEQGPGKPAVVCTSGRPSLVAVEVLEQLCASGSRLRYHGDFDWPGVAMANQAMTAFGARPWLMSAADYLAAQPGPALAGPAVEPLWDAKLGAAMRGRGVAVHEEAVLAALLARL